MKLEDRPVAQLMGRISSFTGHRSLFRLPLPHSWPTPTITRAKPIVFEAVLHHAIQAGAAGDNTGVDIGPVEHETGAAEYDTEEDEDTKAPSSRYFLPPPRRMLDVTQVSSFIPLTQRWALSCHR